MSDSINLVAASWYEATARERIAGLLDQGSFHEYIGPAERVMSPHLSQFGLTGAFDDGIVVGCGLLDGKQVLIAAQEGKFMGGAFGEVHGAKMVGLLRAALKGNAPSAVLLALDTGGVRLQEANAGEQAISEIINAIVDVRLAGIPVIALIGGKSGAFGGGGIITATCSRIVVAEHARISVSGPEVIETNKGVEEFDARDKALVWRVTGGRTRYLEGGADYYVKGAIRDFRAAAIKVSASSVPLSLQMLKNEQARLEHRLERYGKCRDSVEMWTIAGIPEPDQITNLSDAGFLAIKRSTEASHDAR